MFSMCSELTPRAHIPDTRIPQLMQPCLVYASLHKCDHIHYKKIAILVSKNEGGGVKGRLEFFKKIIRFGTVARPLAVMFLLINEKKTVEGSKMTCSGPQEFWLE